MHLPLFDLSAAKIEVHHCSSVESLYNLIILKKTRTYYPRWFLVDFSGTETGG